jgi:TctA family transporter
VLLGLLALGPAIAVLARSPDARYPALSAPPAWPATLLPLALFAMPVTATAALLSLALGEHGLSAGHALITQRSRLALALVLAPLVVTLAAILIMLALRRLPRPAWTTALDAPLRLRLAATAVAALALIALSGLGAERAELILLAGAAFVGGALHWFGRSPAPLVIGLTIGELMRPALAPALKTGMTDVRTGLVAAGAGLTVVAALCWPWLYRGVRDRIA